jgi:hypothetical protein
LETLCREVSFHENVAILFWDKKMAVVRVQILVLWDQFMWIIVLERDPEPVQEAKKIAPELEKKCK